VAFKKKPAPGYLQRQLAALTLRLVTLERDQRNLKLDYLETYDKVQRLMSRVAKRAALDNPAPVLKPEPEHDPYSHLDKISADIMRRRANGAT